MTRFIFTLAAAVIALSHQTTTFAQMPPDLKRIKVATGEWPPFSSEAFRAPFSSYGRIADIVRAAFQEAKVNATIEFHDFADAEDMARRRLVGAAFPYYKTEDRAGELTFSEPLLTVTDVIFYNKKHAPKLAGITELNELQLKMALGENFKSKARFVKGYCYVPELQNPFGRDCKKPRWNDMPTEIDAFKALLDDRDVALLPAARQVGNRILQTWFDEKERDSIGIIASLKWDRDVFLVAAKEPGGQKSELVGRFNEGLRAIKKSGEYRALETAALPEGKVLRRVQLGDPGTFPLVIASEKKEAEEIIVLPRGTTALVVKWSPNFLTPKKTTLQRQLRQKSRVKISDGPQQGQLLWVQNIFIELP